MRGSSTGAKAPVRGPQSRSGSHSTTNMVMVAAMLATAALLLYIQSVAVSSEGGSRLPSRFHAGKAGSPVAADTASTLSIVQEKAGSADQRPPAKHAHSYAHVDTFVVPPYGGREPSSLIKSPSDFDLVAARSVLAEQCTDPEAWDMQWWFRNRSASVVAQTAVRAALNTEGDYYVSRMAARDEKELRPCKRTVVSIATIPSRISMLYNLIWAIRLQEVPPDAILIALPPFAPRLKQSYTIPDFLTNDPLVKIVHLPVDFGPLSKLAAAIYSEPDPDTCIFTVDDDNEPRPHLFKVVQTWASLFPNAAIGECGWNTTCITNRIPHVCGEGYDVFLFIRQDWDTLCQPENLPLYNFHECLGPVDKTHTRATDVLMGVSNPMYRRGMFGDDFLDIAKIVAKRKIRRMLDAHYRALGTALPTGDVAASLSQDQAQQVRLSVLVGGSVNSPVAGMERAAMPKSDAPKAAAAADAAKAAEGHSANTSPDVLPETLVTMAHTALAHPDLEETDTLLRWKRANPPDSLFLVDDVYISAYLACKGVPRLIVPAGANAEPPIPFAQRQGEPLVTPPPRPENDRRGDLSAVDALHGVAHFNLGNYEAVRFFHQEGCW